MDAKTNEKCELQCDVRAVMEVLLLKKEDSNKNI